MGGGFSLLILAMRNFTEEWRRPGFYRTIAPMQVVERSALVNYSPAQMFALVNDVGRYPEFLPWCVSSKVEDVSPVERIASLKVARGVLSTEFTTKNRLTPDSAIHMQLL